MNLVIYRKYRPQTFSEVIGQESIVRTLTNALLLGKVGHAYLFCGPRGTGKTTMARLLAKALNCEQRGQSAEPCNQCQSCLAISQGNALDLIELDAASNRGIDEIRQLREGIKFSPTQSKYKVFIIDEAHMLTKEACNALLKTLEEPPNHAYFILATTEAYKILPTIISRCQKFDFTKIPSQKIKQSLQNIAQKEGYKIDEAAAGLIAQTAQGYLRDGQSILAKILASADATKPISVADVQDLLGLPDYQNVIQLADFLSLGQTKEAILLVNQISEAGYDLAQFTKLFVVWLRQIAILKVDPTLRELAAAHLTDEQFAVILKQSQALPQAKILEALNLFSDAEIKTKISFLPQMPLEIAIIEMGLSDQDAISKIV